MTAPDHVRVLPGTATGPARIDPAGAGQCAILLRKSPDRAEDAACEDAAALVSWDGTCGVIVVADGLGGHGEGEVAAKITVEAITARVRECEPEPAALQTAVLQAIDAANTRLVDRAGSAATTVLVAAVDGRQFRSYHAGDSELLLVGQRGKLKHQTVSHSPIGYAVEAGIIDAAQGFEHEDRHIVSNCIGMVGMKVEVGSAIRLAARDTLVLASDGLWDNLHVGEVAEIVRKGPLDRAAATLEERCLLRMRGGDPKVAGKPDDLTVILYRPAPPGRGR